MISRVILCSIAAGLSLHIGRADGPSSAVQFPYSPARHMSAICLPDDWHKPLITQDGGLAYDFGPGPYAQPLTEVTFGFRRHPSPAVRQSFEDARIPIPLTFLVAGDDTIRVEAFSIVPPGDSLPRLYSGEERVIRLGGLNGSRNWAMPPDGTDPVFRSVAWGANRPIRYKVKVLPGSRKRVALGVCESYKPRAGMRLLSLQVEGSPHRTVDPMVDGVKNRPYVFLFDGEDSNADGYLNIESHAAADSPDPNVILNGFWVFPQNAPLTPEEVISGEARSRAELVWECGRELDLRAPLERMEALRARTSGKTPLVLHIRSRRYLTLDNESGTVLADGVPFCLTSPFATRSSRQGDTLTLHWPDGTGSVDAIVLGGKVRKEHPHPLPDLSAERERVIRYWIEHAPLPHGEMRVPDARLQYLIDASTRNIYQIRDIVDGGVQFQPGPTVYRGLWLGDVLISGGVCLMLGDTAGVRRALEHGMAFQSPSGQFIVLRPSTSLIETPTFLIMMCRYAAAAGADDWLRRHWTIVQRGIGWIEHTRNHTYDDENAAYAGLVPPGFVDGGIAHKSADYGTVWWVLGALEHAIEAAERLGCTEDAGRWRALRSDYDAPLRAAIRKDLRRDPRGLEYLPATIGDTTSGIPPQRGQYTFLLPYAYGRSFFSGDTILERAARGTLAMLDATTEEGMIVGSGWMSDGLWSWLAGTHSMVHHYRDRFDAAWLYLNAFADHATPFGTWVEEQQPRSIGTRTAGDASNAEASAIFLQTVRTFLMRERGDTLQLLAGFPAEWATPGSHTRVHEGKTLFGTISLDVSVSAKGNSITIGISGLSPHASAVPVVLFLDTFRNLGYIDAAGGDAPRRLISSHAPTVVTLKRER